MTAEAAENMEPSPQEHEPTEITYSEQCYAARPRSLRPKARLRADTGAAAAERVGEPEGTNAAYVDGLIRESMLNEAKQIASQLAARAACGRTPTRAQTPSPPFRPRPSGSPPTRSP